MSSRTHVGQVSTLRRCITAIAARQAALKDCLLVVRAPRKGRRCRAESARGPAATPRPGGEDRDEGPSALIIRFPTAEDAETVTATSGGVDTGERVTSLPRGIWSRMLRCSDDRRGSSALDPLPSCSRLPTSSLLPMGRDLSAQLAHRRLAGVALARAAGSPLVWRL